MTKLMGLLVLGLPLFAHASLKELPYPDIKCRDELRATLEDWKVEGEWKAQPIIKPLQPTYVASTTEVGAWAQIQINLDHTVSAVLIKDGWQSGVHWTLKPEKPVSLRSSASTDAGAWVCAKETSRASKKIFSPTSAATFTDVDLKKLMAANPKGGLILIWSPGMVYSLRAVKDAQSAMMKLGLPLEVIVDSEADEKSAKAALEGTRLPASVVKMNRSLELYMRDMEIHFPSAIYYADGRFAKPLLPGLMTEEGYTNYVKGGLK